MEDKQIDTVFREKLKNCNKLPNVQWNKEAGWKNLEKNLPQRIIFRNTWFKLAIAASVIGISFLGGFFIQKYYSSTSILAFAANRTIKEIKLPGGHHCTLAPFSKIQYSHSSVSGILDTLYIEGEAYVESSEKRLLVIKAKNTLISCTNATLSIRADFSEKTVIISTISGIVIAQCLDNHLPALLVSPTEQFTVFEAGIMAFKAKNNDPNFLAWKTGTLTFDNVPLEYAVKVMEEYYGVYIQIEKEDMKYCRITSHFKHLSLEEAFQNISLSLNLKVKQKGLMYSLAGRGC